MGFRFRCEYCKVYYIVKNKEDSCEIDKGDYVIRCCKKCLKDKIINEL